MDNYLIRGKKCEVRQYVLVASVEPYVVLYHEGLVTMTLEPHKENYVTGNYTIDKWNFFSSVYAQSTNPLFGEIDLRKNHTLI